MCTSQERPQPDDAGRGRRECRAQRVKRPTNRTDPVAALPARTPAWRTRTDPLADVWDSEVAPLLQADARLNAVTLLEELQRRHPGDYDERVLRTLQRRIRQWRPCMAPSATSISLRSTGRSPGAIGLPRV